MAADVLDRFSPATAAWFRGSFTAPTAAQAGAWEAISSGQHALVVAPTGSGKTLSAFLWALDRLAAEPPPAEKLKRCRVLYVSPMKALAVDVERNLRSPLVGIGHAATRLGLTPPDITVSVRSGDTPAGERRAFARTPTDVLITTPESLFLILTSQAREALAGVETVILDEVHAVAGTKRGAHLALSLERLDALLEKPAQRIGLSATVEPVSEVARYLAGGRPVEIVRPPSTKEWDLDVVVPIADMSALGEVIADDLSGPASGAERRASIWPHVEERIVDLVSSHRSTLVFANSRRLAERLTARLNEIWDERLETIREAQGDEPPEPAPRHAGHRTPAQLMAQSGASSGAPAVLARAHHGSVSKEHRQLIEEDLKAGRLPAVVATSSLELGIDMGAVDLVIQVESPPSVASGLQRVGRAGHQVGAVSRGVLFPKFRGDLVQTAVVVERMRAGAIESLRVPANPVDVLAQQIVAMCALDEWTVDDLESVVRKATPFAALPRSILESVLDMLSGRYPSDEFAELRPRIVWDRVTGVLTGRPGAQRLAVTSGGTIPDRGLYAVFLASSEGAGRRVGELDEEMVYESRVGDVFTLGTSTWRIEDITHDRVLVTPAPGLPGRLPFWKGDQQGRPAELGRAVGAFVREVVGLSPAKARARVEAAGLDEWAADNLLGYLKEQQEATRHVPDDRTIVVERFRDEIGDWRVAVHSPFGGQVHAPWALCVSARMRERYGVDVQAMHGDDGIVFRLPDLEFEDDGGTGRGVGAELLELVRLDADDVHDLVTAEIGGSALFAARFRECASRALLLPRRRPDRRQPLWQQRQRAAQLLEVASQYASFPIVLETVRECVQDVFDVPGLTALMRSIESREVTLVDVESSQPSPFARSLMFGYVAQFLYEGDSPLAEKRAAALALDPTLLAELLGRGEGLSLRDLLDPAEVTRTEPELQRLVEERACRDAEDVADLLRVLGPLPLDAIRARSQDALSHQEIGGWLVELEGARRVIRVRVAGQERWAAIEDAGRLRDALGCSLPVGIPQTFLESVPDPLGDLVAPLRPHPRPLPRRRGRRLVGRRPGRGPGCAAPAGLLRPRGRGRAAPDRERRRPARPRLLRRRGAAAAAPSVAGRPAGRGGAGAGRRAGPVPARSGSRSAGVCAGARVWCARSNSSPGRCCRPARSRAWSCPSRVVDYSAALLDDLTSSGEVLWRGHGSLPGDDGWVSLHLADTAHLTLAPLTDRALTETEQAVVDALAGGGAYFFRTLADAVGSTDDEQLLADLWALAWDGRVSNDTLTPLRALLAGGRTSHKRSRPGPRTTRYAGRRGSLGALSGQRGLGRAAVPTRSGPAAGAGRWSLLPEAEPDATVRAYATAEVLLDRYGVVTRGSVVAEEVPGGFAGVYRVLAAAEESGRVRRGYFVESLGASQFSTTGAIDRLRAGARPVGDEADRSVPAMVLAATDPANPYGAALPWPDRRRSAPTDADDPAVPDRPGGQGRAGKRGHQPRARPGRWSCSSTASSSSTSSAAARRCCRGPTTSSPSRVPPMPWPWRSVRVPWAG